MKYLSFLAFLIALSISCASATTAENAQVSGQHVKRNTQIRKVERSFVIKAPLSQMHDIWSTKLPLMSTICPDQIRSVDVLEGLWGNQGSVVVWKYNHKEKVTVVKAIIEEMDKENNRIVHKLIEGGPLDIYKSFRSIYQASPNDKVVRWTLEYETDNKVVADPDGYLDMLTSMMERIDAYLVTGA